MARYRKIDPKVWNDQKFMSLTNNGKLIFFYILTHPALAACGAMRASIPGLAAELKWDEKDFREAFHELLDKDMLKHDSEACFIWFPKFLKYNRPESPNVTKAWATSLDYLPECSMKTELIQMVKVFLEGLNKAFQKAFEEGLGKALPYQKQKQKQKKKKIPAGKSAGLPFFESDKKTAQAKKKPRTYTSSEPAYELSELLFNSILKNSPQSRMHSYQNGQKEDALQSWAVDIDLLLRKDLRKQEVIKEVILFSTGDDFWSSNILSGRSLRKQWDKLVKQMTKSKTSVSKTSDAPGEYYLNGRRLPTA